MDIESVFQIGRQALLLVVWVTALPILVTTTVTLIASLLQAATQLQEQTLSIVPKLLACFAVFFFFGPSLIRELANFATMLLSLIGGVH